MRRGETCWTISTRCGKTSQTRRAKATTAPAEVPVEFDALLTETPDHPGARAVEAELGRLNIAFFRTERGDAVNRVVELHVRSADRDRASQAAAMIFARRRRLDQLAPRRPAPRYDPQTGGSIDGLTSMLPP